MSFSLFSRTVSKKKKKNFFLNRLTNLPLKNIYTPVNMCYLALGLILAYDGAKKLMNS